MSDDLRLSIAEAKTGNQEVALFYFPGLEKPWQLHVG